jgi:hypothetical protein
MQPAVIQHLLPNCAAFAGNNDKLRIMAMDVTDPAMGY